MSGPPRTPEFPRIPGFDVIDRIGYGGFATVYRARQPGLDRMVAIKVVHRGSEADDEVLRRFRRECQAIGSLTGHPSVMTVFDLGTTFDGDPYLVLEYLEGGSLQEALDHLGALAWTDVVDVGISVVQALSSAHGVGILHRDVKPANVLRDRFGNCRLGDFGIARLAGMADSSTTDAAMTISYAAPEVLRGERASEASDLYSLGALLYTLLAGRAAFSRPDDDSVAAVILRITTEPVPPLDVGLGPSPLLKLIAEVMAKDVDARPDAATIARRLTAVKTSGHTFTSRRAHSVNPDPGSPRSQPSDARGPISRPVSRQLSQSAGASGLWASGSGRRPLTDSGSGRRLSLSGGRGAWVDHNVSEVSRRGPRAVPRALGYAVDIVFVIDITASMYPVIGTVKAGALAFHDRLVATMAAKDKHVARLRLRVVAYRDYYDHADDALFHTPFFTLPEDQRSFAAYIGSLSADGGGDEPESGLEALAIAFASDWERGMDRRRHVVVLFTDASAHPLEAAQGRFVAGYPTGIPHTFDALTDQWDDPQGAVMQYSSKRLLMYAPDVYPWNVISTYWDNVMHFPSRAGDGLGEVEFSQIIEAIAGSV